MVALGHICTVTKHKPVEVVHVGSGIEGFGHDRDLYIARGDGNPIWLDEAGALDLAEMICKMYDREIVKVNPVYTPTYQARRPK